MEHLSIPDVSQVSSPKGTLCKGWAHLMNQHHLLVCEDFGGRGPEFGLSLNNVRILVCTFEWCQSLCNVASRAQRVASIFSKMGRQKESSQLEHWRETVKLMASELA